MRKSASFCLIIIMVLFSGCSTNQQKNVSLERNNDIGQINKETKQAVDEQQVVEKELISFKTPLLDKRKNRLKNIRLAVDSINEKVIQPGEEFSFNNTVGKRTINRGYKEAIVFIENKKEKEVGGGICQVSSTIYAAAKYAGLEITERHEHQLEVNYIGNEDDATVYFGKLDLKFKNNTQNPIRIYIILEEDDVLVTLNSILTQKKQ